MNTLTSAKRFKLPTLRKLALVTCLALACTACNMASDKDGGIPKGETDNNVDPAPRIKPAPGEEQYSLLHQDGIYWANAQDELVSLRGVNLGNWLMNEVWMFDSGANPLGAGIEDQCSLEAKLTERFGAQEKERLMDIYRSNFITKRDWDILADFKFNLIRIPFPYDLIEDAANPRTLREDAWQFLDYAVTEAKKREMYVILDLHGAAGRQGWEHHSGCAGLNQFWDGDNAADNQDRTSWLWQQIATRYKDDDTIAGYGLINEPWGTTPETLAAVSTKLYEAVREVDERHVVILPGHSAGVDAYGNPAEHGLSNVALEMHFYPGIFGWGEIGYQVHRDWLTCGQSGTSGVCEWQTRMDGLKTPFLIGEMQPWAGLGELGGPITRATFDNYNAKGWAATAWSYKLLSKNGGQGNGTWGLVTNKGERLLAKASTWSCAGWDTTLDQACENPSKIVTPVYNDQTYYLIVKSGSLGSGQNILIDDLQLVAQSSGENIVMNSGFDTAQNWTKWSATHADPMNDALEVTVGYAQGSENMLRINAGASFVNGGVYQAVNLKAGESYLLSGHFKDDGSTDTWAEFYLLPDAPTNGQDISAAAMPSIDLNTAALADIESYFALMASVEYEVNQSVFAALTAAEPADIFHFPDAPQQLTLEETTAGMQLVWLPVADSTYIVYRTNTSGTGYSQLSTELNTEIYLDDNTAEGVTYFYVVSAKANGEESYYSNEVSTTVYLAAIPGTIEAEHFSSQTGFQLEDTQDVGGGQNLGYTDAGDTLSYEVEVAAAGEYRLDIRIASSGGSDGLRFVLGDEVLATVVVTDTGGWQNWVTLTTTVTLPAGANTLHIEAVGGAWNLNWFSFTEK